MVEVKNKQKSSIDSIRNAMQINYDKLTKFEQRIERTGADNQNQK